MREPDEMESVDDPVTPVRKPTVEPWFDDPPAAEPETDVIRPRVDRWARRLAVAQGAFYFLSGIWPILHPRSFLAATGPKTDVWLAQTVGALLAVIGLGLLLASRHRLVPGEWRFMGAAVALVLAVVDVIFVGRHVISPIYLADAGVELVIAAIWCTLALRAPERTDLPP